jgi:PAS domain S-box-containing protein
VRQAVGARRSAEPSPPGITSAEESLVDEILHDRQFVESLPVVLTILSRDLRILHVSRSFEEVRLSDILGTCALDHLKTEDRARYAETVETVWTTGRDAVLEFQTLNGQYWEARLRPARKRGEIAAVFATATETTARRQALADLRDNENRLRLALEATGMGTWSWDVRTGAVHWDSVICTLYGLEPEDVPKSYDDYMQLLHPDDRPRIATALRAYLDTGRYDDLEHRIVRPDGEVRHVLAKATAIRNEDGSVVGFRGGVFDITERKRLEEQLNQAQKMEAIGLLTAGIAHNFNNLLTVILPNVVLCRMDAVGEDAERLADVEYAARRAGELVRELMLVTRPNVGTRKNHLDLVAACRRAVEMSRGSLDLKIKIELHAPPDEQMILGNATQIEQVLLNLCLNCRDAFDAAGTKAPRILIHVSRARSGKVCVRVSDNGPGMDESTRSRVFEPFFTTKSNGRGTGLGLASAYAIISDHGGQIRCDSISGEGTSFEIELPISTTAPSAPAPPPSEAEGGSETLLLIDDEELVRRALRNVLETAGYSVLEAGCGTEGLATFQRERERIALVLLDRSMPEMSGEVVLERLVALGVRAPVMFVTGHHGGIEAGHATRVLPKPVDRETLLLAVREVIDAASVKQRAVGEELA